MTITEVVWSEAFESEEIALEVDGLEWIVRRNGESAHLDELEVRKVHLGVALAGVSPKAVAQSIREALDQEST